MTGSRVLLLEASTLTPPLTTPTQPFSNRVCALSLGSVQLLKRNLNILRSNIFSKKLTII